MHYTNSNSTVMKQYRLLRDNKETGPYAAEELIQSGLKKYDLVWVEGKSAAWRYPCEIEAFKPFVPAVEEQPFDRFYKKSPVSSAQQVTTITETAQVTINDVKKEKPRFKIKADCQKIETIVTTVPAVRQEIPSYNTNSYNTYSEPIKQPEPAKANTVTTPAWENMWLDWEQEKQAVSNASLVKNVEARVKALGRQEEALETKFSQSLDDIKERYVETILNKKNSSGSFEKYKSHLTAAVLLIAILAAGMWVGLKWSDKTGYTADKTPQQNIQLIPNETSPEANTENNQQVIDNNTVNEENAAEQPLVENELKQSNIVSTVSRTVAPASNQQKKALPNSKAVVNTANKSVAFVPKINPPVEAVQKNYQPSVTTANGSRSAVKRNDAQGNVATETVNQEPVKTNEVVKKPAKRNLSVDDYVDIESYSIPSGVQYSVSNISDVPLDLVMIDLQYFDTAGRYLKGETIYAKNIAAGQSVKVNAPQNAKASGIKYKVSMVSSSENDLNIIAD
ncbi:hypothetical protein BH10BAC2_BH10BAC2_19540 [soil metagenome]